MSRDWSMVSATNGLDAQKDSPFTFVKINVLKDWDFDGVRTYQIHLKGNGPQYSYMDQVRTITP